MFRKIIDNSRVFVALAGFLTTGMLMAAPNMVFAEETSSSSTSSSSSSSSSGTSSSSGGAGSSWSKACTDNMSAEAAQAAGCDQTGTTTDSLMTTTIAPIINTVLGVVTIIAVVVIVISGINLTVAGGDPQKVAKARFAMMYAVIGLIIALLAFAIVNFAISGVFS